MTAAQSAADRIRSGTPPALAVHIAAREYGTTTHAVAAGLARNRKPHRRHEAPANAWWDR